MSNEEYEKSMLKWRAKVENNLRRENGWPALCLYRVRDMYLPATGESFESCH